MARTPAFIILAGLCCSVFFCARGAFISVSVIAGILISCSWILLCTERITPDWMPCLLIILILTLIISLFCVLRIDRKIYLPSSLNTTGKIIMSRPWGKRSAILLSTGHGKFVYYVNHSEAPPEGSKVRIDGALFDFKRSDSAGGFDEYLYWRSKGAVKKIIPIRMETLAGPSGISYWRNFIRSRIAQNLPARMSGYMLALTVGERDGALAELHRNAGTVHLLSISGFHVGILAAFVSMLFRRGICRIVSLSVVLWLYILLAGAPPGGVRAALMLQIYLLGLLIGKPSSAFNSVSAAGVILIICNPWCFFDIGWRLSMIAALFLSAAGTLMRRSWFSALCVSLLLWLVTAPQVAWAFKEVPVAGILINAFAIPFFSLIFPAVFLFSLPSVIGIPFGYSIAEAFEYLLKIWEIFSQTAIRVFPWSISYTFPLLLISSVLMGIAAAYASGVSRNKILLPAAIFPLFLLLFA